MMDDGNNSTKALTVLAIKIDDAKPATELNVAVGFVSSFYRSDDDGFAVNQSSEIGSRVFPFHAFLPVLRRLIGRRFVRVIGRGYPKGDAIVMVCVHN